MIIPNLERIIIKSIFLIILSKIIAALYAIVTLCKWAAKVSLIKYYEIFKLIRNNLSVHGDNLYENSEIKCV